mgnify:FL=1
MQLLINNDFRIASDSKQFILQKRSIQGAESKNPGTEVWANVGYYQTLAGLAKDAVHYGLRTSELEDVQEMADYIDQFLLGFTGKVFTLGGKDYQLVPITQ